MLLTTREMEFLKVLCWCKSIPVPAGRISSYFYTQEDISALMYFGFVYAGRDGGSIRPRPKAYRLLVDAGINYKSDTKVQTNPKVLARRNIAAQILLTFHGAVISVFNNELPPRVDTSVYIASSAARARDHGNPFGSTRFHGIFCTTQEAFLVFYADDFGVHFQNELNLFHNFIEITGIQNTAIIMMERSTAQIGSRILNVREIKERSKYNLITDSFAEIFEKTSLPVHFIPTGDAGAQMLKIMLIPNYRETIAKAILKKSYKPPYKDMPDTDTVHYTPPHNPAVVSVDMDVKRIDRAVASAKSAGFEKIAIYALPEQMQFLRNRYANTGTADVMKIDIDNINSSLKHSIELYQPPDTLYVTDEGRCFNVSDIAAYRKAGKQGRP